MLYLAGRFVSRGKVRAGMGGQLRRRVASAAWLPFPLFTKAGHQEPSSRENWPGCRPGCCNGCCPVAANVQQNECCASSCASECMDHPLLLKLGVQPVRSRADHLFHARPVSPSPLPSCPAQSLDPLPLGVEGISLFPHSRGSSRLASQT